MSFEIFHKRLPWQPKLPCNFHKNIIYVIRTLSLIFLWKISFLAQRVHVSEILRHFSQFYPTHLRLVYDSTGTILAILYGKVPHMLPAKYQRSPPGGSGEEDFWRVFTIIWAWWPSWISDQNHFSHFSFPQSLDATYEIWLHLAQWFQRRSRLKVWTEDGGFPYYKLPQSLRLRGAKKLSYDIWICGYSKPILLQKA